MQRVMPRSVFVLPRSYLCSFHRNFLMTKISTTAAPISPKFISAEGNEIPSRSQPDGFRFRVISYNMLAQAYVKSFLFPHSPSPCLKWKARSQAILTVLKNFRAGFLCLQELDEYEAFYKGKMESLGYSSVYIQRSGQKRDGCAIFYKHDIAELIEEEKIEYNDLAREIEDEALTCNRNNTEYESGVANTGATQKNIQQGHGDSNDPGMRLKRDCVGIICAFRLLDPSRRLLIVANTHLYWDPEWADVKLAQAKYLLSRLAQFKTRVSHKYGCMPSVILAGDFNSTPGDKVYQYLVSGNSLPRSEQEIPKDLPIPLCSVYAYTRGEPPFTNCTPDFTNTLDYIFFYPCGFIKPVGFLELPGPGSDDIAGGLPNYYHPSDHLPIGGEFEVTGP